MAAGGGRPPDSALQAGLRAGFERRPIDDRDDAPLDRDHPLLLKLGHRPGHGLATGADHLGDRLMRELLHERRRFTRVGVLEQHLCDAPRHVEQHETANGPVCLSEPPCQLYQESPGHLRVLLDLTPEVGAAENQQTGGLRGDHMRRPGTPVDKRQLPEVFSDPQDVENHFAPIVADEHDLHLAGSDHKERVTGITGREDHRVLGEPLLTRQLGEAADGAPVQFTEQWNGRQKIRDPVQRHAHHRWREAEWGRTEGHHKSPRSVYLSVIPAPRVRGGAGLHRTYRQAFVAGHVPRRAPNHASSYLRCMLTHLRDRMAEALMRATEVEQLLADPETTRDAARLASLGREHSRLAEVVRTATRLQKAEQELADARELANGDDPDFAAEARSEMARLEAECAELEKAMLPLLIPRDPLDDRPAIVEIRAGTGGDEAGLFAGDLVRMYTRFIERRGWRIEPIAYSEGTLGGIKESVFKVAGDGAFGVLRWESGVHRVQRVPATESQGRIHTSAATVAVLPEADEVDLRIEDKDLRIDVFRSSGPGGQSVNTTDSAVRITHIPSGIVVSQQDQKSQLQNKLKAMEVLRARLLDLRLSEQEAERSRMRKSQVSTGDRSAKIRTYNFPQGRVTDHRVGVTLYDIDRVMDGDITPFLDALALANAEEKLSA
ncbi:MAG: peptide chain release factor 1 [Gemmatimonadota bacterium]